jgi:hypothetical protein
MQAFLAIDWKGVAWFILAFLGVLALIWGSLYALKRLSGGALGGATGTRGRQPRLAVIESTMIDARRQLWLIRRDNVEHLILTGGPTDLVVEPGIVRATPAGSAREAAAMREAPPMREAPAMRETPPIRETPVRDAAPARVTPSLPDTLPRAVSLADGGNWPLQPEAPPTRLSRAAPPPPPPAPPAPPPLEAVEPEPDAHDAGWSPPEDPVLDTEPPPREPALRAEPPPTRPEPPMRAEPPVRAEPMLRAVPDLEPAPRAERPPRVARAQSPDRQNSDRLSGLAADLSRSFMDPDLSAPRRPAEPRRATPPPVQPLESTPQLSEAEEQNLTEMAQRLESALSRPRPAQESVHAPAPAATPPALRAVEIPRIEPVRPEARPRPEPVPPPAGATTRPAAKALPTAAPTTAPTPVTKPAAKPAFGTLEQEMASLLGRSSSGKT